MKKEDFKKSIDNINPDIYMVNRLKTKIMETTNIPVKRNVQMKRGIAAICLALVMIFGAGFFIQPTVEPTNQGIRQDTNNTSTTGNNKTVNPFIMIASAVNVEDDETIRTTKILKLNEEHPYALRLKVTDMRGLSEEEKDDIYKKLFLKESVYIDEEILAESSYATAMVSVRKLEDFCLTLLTFNGLQLDLENTGEIKSVNVKNTSKYSHIQCYVDTPTSTMLEADNEITIEGNQFDCDEDSFYWQPRAALGMALEENMDLPFSTFNDTITFTVEYNDGTKLVGVVDLIFDEDGSAGVVCKSYDYSS